MSSIYEFFEPGVLLAEKTKTGHDNYSYVCRSCKNKSFKKDGEEIKIKCEKCKLC
jgi:hypothetical protein